MTLKPRIWFPIAAVLSVVNVVAAGAAAADAEPWHAGVHALLAAALALWAQRLRQRATGSHGDDFQRQLEEQAVVLEDAQATIANQAAQLAELQERIDFAERMLLQARDRASMPASPAKPPVRDRLEES